MSTEVERDGRKVSLVAVRLHDGDTEVARARSLRIRVKQLALPDDVVQPAPDPPGTPHRRGRPACHVGAVDDHVAFHTGRVRAPFHRGRWDIPGPVGVWIRLRVPVAPHEAPSGVQRAAAAADFGNGVSGGLPFDRFTFINPDLTVHLLRRPVGDWIGMRTASHYGTDTASSGAGFAESALFDVDGRLGRSVQSLILDER